MSAILDIISFLANVDMDKLLNVIKEVKELIQAVKELFDSGAN